MERSNTWRKGESLSSGLIQGLILSLRSLVLSYRSFCEWLELWPSSSFFFPLFLEGLLCYIPSFHWSWPSICWSCKLLLECLSHLPPSSSCCELQQTRRYCSRIISSLMRPGCQLWAFNAEVTASPGIAPPPHPHNWSTVLVFCLGCLGRLSLRVCRFLLSWPQLVEDRVVLGNVS